MNKYHATCCVWVLNAGIQLLLPDKPNVAAAVASLGAAYAFGILARAWVIIREDSVIAASDAQSRQT